jgi:hypothetical protein
MALRTFTPLLLAILLSVSPFANSEYNKNENIVLADCGIGENSAHPEWASAFWILYYPGEVWSDVEETKVNHRTLYGRVPWDGSYPWRENGVTATLNNGDVVTVSIHPNVNDPDRAGQLTHKYDGHALTCWSYHKDLLGVTGKCRSAYVCNHKDGAHPANRDKTKIALSTTKDFAKLYGNINAADVYAQLSYGDDGSCDESWKNAGGGCKIRFICHGNLKGITPAMDKMLQQVAKDAELVKHETTPTKQVWDPCMSGKDNCIGGWRYEDEDWTWLPQTMSIDVSNKEGADVGALRYEIDCSGGPQCDVCKKAKFGLGFLSFMANVFSPVVGAGAELLVQTASATCLLNGC